MDAIRAESLVKKFGKVNALDHTSVSVKKGELFFLLGASGCGKTTLLRCIAGLEAPTSGRILYGDRDVTQLPTYKREAAMVFQNYALWPHMSVGENVGFGLVERKVPKEELNERVDEALAMVHLEGFNDRRIDQLSGGQQQRVALARALVVKPECLLLDEPLSNLDAQLRLEMRREIRKIVKENDLTAIYVTHDQEEALSMADRMAVMEAGRIVQIGTPDDVYKRPLSSHVAEFIGETNLIEATVVRVGHDDDELDIRVSCAAGDFHGHITRVNWQPTAGTKVLMSIRPEALYPDISGVPINRIRGTVVDHVYLGNTIQYLIKGEGDLMWTMMETNPQGIRNNGDEVMCRAEPLDVIVLKV